MNTALPRRARGCRRDARRPGHLRPPCCSTPRKKPTSGVPPVSTGGALHLTLPRTTPRTQQGAGVGAPRALGPRAALILRERGVDVVRPGQDAAREVLELAE